MSVRFTCIHETYFTVRARHLQRLHEHDNAFITETIAVQIQAVKSAVHLLSDLQVVLCAAKHATFSASLIAIALPMPR